jgi:hypothetical protein
VWRFAPRVVCVACVIAAAAGCRDEEDRKPSGTLVLQLLRPGEPLAAVDLPAGKPTIARGLALAGGDPPLRLLRTGGRLVCYGAALIDVATGAARVIAGARLSGYRNITWSSSGRWLFFNARAGRIAAHAPGPGRTTLLPFKLKRQVLDMAAS